MTPIVVPGVVVGLIAETLPVAALILTLVE
jgi:hypothetical protein